MENYEDLENPVNCVGNDEECFKVGNKKGNYIPIGCNNSLLTELQIGEA